MQKCKNVDLVHYITSIPCISSTTKSPSKDGSRISVTYLLVSGWTHQLPSSAQVLTASWPETKPRSGKCGHASRWLEPAAVALKQDQESKMRGQVGRPGAGRGSCQDRQINTSAMACIQVMIQRW